MQTAKIGTSNRRRSFDLCLASAYSLKKNARIPEQRLQPYKSPKITEPYFGNNKSPLADQTPLAGSKQGVR